MQNGLSLGCFSHQKSDWSHLLNGSCWLQEMARKIENEGCWCWKMRASQRVWEGREERSDSFQFHQTPHRFSQFRLKWRCSRSQLCVNVHYTSAHPCLFIMNFLLVSFKLKTQNVSAWCQNTVYKKEKAI